VDVAGQSLSEDDVRSLALLEELNRPREYQWSSPVIQDDIYLVRILFNGDKKRMMQLKQRTFSQSMSIERMSSEGSSNGRLSDTSSTSMLARFTNLSQRTSISIQVDGDSVNRSKVSIQSGTHT
jgi:hypothetical protein